MKNEKSGLDNLDTNTLERLRDEIQVILKYRYKEETNEAFKKMAKYQNEIK